MNKLLLHLRYITNTIRGFSKLTEIYVLDLIVREKLNALEIYVKEEYQVRFKKIK